MLKGMVSWEIKEFICPEYTSPEEDESLEVIHDPAQQSVAAFTEQTP